MSAPEANRASKPPSSVTFRSAMAVPCWQKTIARFPAPQQPPPGRPIAFSRSDTRQLHAGVDTKTPKPDHSPRRRRMIIQVAGGSRVCRGLTLARAAFLALALTSLITAAPAIADPAASWSMSGKGITNWRFQPDEVELRPDNVASLAPVWVASLAGDVSATPAVVDGAVYVPDWGGNVSKLDATTGAVIWSRSVATLLGVPSGGFPAAVSRTSPAVANDVVVFGSQAGAYLFAVNRQTGNLKWKTQLDAHPTAVVTQSPTIYRDTVYVGVASLEEVLAGNVAGYPCCTFRGSALAVNLGKGKIKWKTYTTFNNGSPAATPAPLSGDHRPPLTSAVAASTSPPATTSMPLRA